MGRELYGPLDVNGNPITGLPLTPTADSEAASKKYVDDQIDTVGAAAGDEILIQPAQPTPVAGLDLWIDTDAPDYVGGGGGGVSDHGALTGLADDDHPQYVKKAGDTMTGGLNAPDIGANTVSVYAAPTLDAHATPKSYVDGALATHEAAADPHPNYLTAAEAPQPATVSSAIATNTNTVGTSLNYARQDHKHQVLAGSPVALGSVASDGVLTTLARADHVHPFPTAANVGAEPAGAVATHAATAGHEPLASTTPAALGTAAVGVGTTVARADHVHQMPSAANVGADPAGTASSAVSTHAGAADPHTGYQLESEKAAANGYASLDASTKVPIAQVPTGTTASTVSLGNHTHTQAQSHGSPDTDTAASSLHHTIGTGANQAAAGNHTHAAPTIDHGTTTGLTDDDHTQYALVVVAAAKPGSPRVGTLWVPTG